MNKAFSHLSKTQGMNFAIKRCFSQAFPLPKKPMGDWKGKRVQAPSPAFPPLYEIVMVARIGDPVSFKSMLKILCSNILQSGGVVRGMENLGDRVLVKSLRSNDGIWYSLGRFIKLDLAANPQLHLSVCRQLRESDEILRVNSNKVSDAEYLDTFMRKVNFDISPFKDKEMYDEDYIKAMWSHYAQLKALRDGSTHQEIEENLPHVASYVRGLQEGHDSADAQTLAKWAKGDLTIEDKQVRDYYIKHY